MSTTRKKVKKIDRGPYYVHFYGFHLTVTNDIQAKINPV
jgi:hypothetical protein